MVYMNQNQKFIIGVDIGGTWIRVAICTQDLKEEHIKIKVVNTPKENKYSISNSENPGEAKSIRQGSAQHGDHQSARDYRRVEPHYWKTLLQCHRVAGYTNGSNLRTTRRRRRPRSLSRQGRFTTGHLLLRSKASLAVGQCGRSSQGCGER